jgi:hypothetical protein
MNLTRVASTAIYTAPAPETLAFLLYDASAPPATIPLESTWAASGTPAAVGYYLFLTSPPTPATLEKQLRAALPATAPTASGCVWAVNDGDPITVAAVLSLTLDAKQEPIVAADTQLPSGDPPFGFAAGTIVKASIGEGVLVLTHPSVAGAYGARSGVSISLTGSITRCASFTGLVSLEAPNGDSALKYIASVEVDPLASGGSTVIGDFGGTLVLTKDAGGYRISDVDY